MIKAQPTFREADFRKSSRSDPQQNCVHVARRAGWVELRDSKTIFGSQGDGRLMLTAEQFEGLLSSTRR